MRVPAPQSWFLRGLIGLLTLAAVVALAWWRGPEWGSVGDAFKRVSWSWVTSSAVAE